jgi:predicted GIY-YIG superfamily endonuclease
MANGRHCSASTKEKTMGTALAAEIYATVRASTGRRQLALMTLARLADDRTRVAHADELRAAGIGAHLWTRDDDKALAHLRDLAQLGLFERLMPPGRAAMDCSFRLPRYDTDWLSKAKDPTVVYRFYDAHDALLYVGISWDPVSRFHQHSKTSKWWPQAVRHTIRWYPDRLEAAELEMKAIWRENPRFNSRLHSLSLHNAMVSSRGTTLVPPYQLIATPSTAANAV